MGIKAVNVSQPIARAETVAPVTSSAGEDRGGGRENAVRQSARRIRLTCDSADPLPGVGLREMRTLTHRERQTRKSSTFFLEQ